MAVIYEELQARIRAVARPEEDPDSLLEAAVQEFIARRAGEQARWEAARAEAQATLNGPRRPWKEADAAFRLKHNLPDRSHLSPDELSDRAEAAIAAMTPAAREALEREGWL